MRAERVDLRHERGRTNQIALLQTTIDMVGNYRHIDDCGEPVTIVEYASTLAWLTHLDVGSVGYIPHREMRQKYPIVLLLPVLDGGWMVGRGTPDLDSGRSARDSTPPTCSQSRTRLAR